MFDILTTIILCFCLIYLMVFHFRFFVLTFISFLFIDIISIGFTFPGMYLPWIYLFFLECLRYKDCFLYSKNELQLRSHMIGLPKSKPGKIVSVLGFILCIAISIGFFIYTYKDNLVIKEIIESLTLYYERYILNDPAAWVGSSKVLPD